MKPNRQQINNIPTSSLVTKTGLTVLMLLLAVGPWLSAPLLWGLNHTGWLPLPVRFLLPLAGFLIIWTPVGSRFGSWLTDGLAPLIFNKSLVIYGLIPAVGAATFWILREQTHMLGDGQTLAVMIAGDNLYHGFDFMTYHLLARIYQATGGGGETAAFRITAMASSLSGAAFLAAAGWSSRRLSDHPGSGLLLYLLLVLGTPLLLFFGYVEVYAPLSVALLVFVTAFILYRENRGSLLAVSLAWSAGLFLHLNALFLAPLLVVALFRSAPEDGPAFTRRLATLIWPPLAALLLAGILLASGGYDLARFKGDFGHVGQGSGILVPLTGPEGLFTWRHLKDTINLVLLLAPIPLLLLIANLRTTSKNPGAAALKQDLVGGSIWLVFLAALVNLKLGAVRDWDLFAPQMCLLSLAGWHAATGGGQSIRLPDRMVGAVTACALILLLPWLAVNIDPDRALARLEAAASDMSPYALGLLHEQFAYHHQIAANPQEVIRHYRRCGEVCPNHPRFHAIYGTHMLNEGHLAEAAQAYERAVAADSTYVYGLKMGVLARVMNADFAGALGPARRLDQLGQQDAEAAAAHGMAAQQLGLRPEAEAAFLRGYSLDPSRLDLLERAAGIQLLERKFNEAETSFRKLVAARPDHGQAALGLADAMWQDYLTQGADRTVEANRARLAEVSRLIGKVMTLDSADASRAAGLKSWQGQVNAAGENPAGR